MRIKHPIHTLGRIIVGRRPIDAQLIVTRRCNLSCGYCTEYDDHSPEVPYEDLCASIDALHRLGVVNISMLGGEPLLHSRIADVIRYAGRHAQVSMTSNGFLLSDDLIEELNQAGLSNMQLSIDALDPDADRYIQKTFKSLRPKLHRLECLAKFGVHCNLVLCEQTLGDFDRIKKELERFPFAVAINLIHDGNGEVQIQGKDYLEKWNQHFESGKAVSFIERDYGAALLEGRRPNWQCRAGSRYLYVDEFGKAQFCSSQIGRLDKPIVDFTRDDLKIHSRSTKGCESGCSIFCVYRVSQADNAPLKTLSSVAEAAARGAFLNRKQLQGQAESRDRQPPPRPQAKVRRRAPVRSKSMTILRDSPKPGSVSTDSDGSAAAFASGARRTLPSQ